MLQIEPALHGRFHGGFYTPGDATGDINKYTAGLAAACIRRGANFHFGTRINATRSSEAGHLLTLQDTESGNDLTCATEALLVCAGVASRNLARTVGDRVNIYPVKGYSITVGLHDSQSRNAAPTVRLLDDAAKIVTSRLGRDRFRVAGTAEFNGANNDIRADRIAPPVRWSRRLFPAMSTSAVIPGLAFGRWPQA